VVMAVWLWAVRVGAEVDGMVPVAEAAGGIERGDGGEVPGEETSQGVAAGEAKLGWIWG